MRYLPVLYIVLCAFSFTACNTYQVKNPEHTTMRSHDGNQIHYRLSGDGGTALVFVHGWSCDRSYWDEQVAAFAQDFTVVTIDLAGHGESGDQRDDWSIPAFGGDVAAVVNGLPHDRVILVGHSMGGPVVVDGARQIGERVKLIVGVDTLHQVTSGRSVAQSQARWAGFAENFPVAVQGFVRSQFFLASSDPALIDRVANDMAAAPPEVAIAAGVGLSVYNAKAGLTATSGIPLTLINATAQPTDRAAHDALRSHFDLHLMSTAGHFLMMEQPRTFNALLRDVVAPYR